MEFLQRYSSNIQNLMFDSIMINVLKHEYLQTRVSKCLSLSSPTAYIWNLFCKSKPFQNRNVLLSRLLGQIKSLSYKHEVVGTPTCETVNTPIIVTTEMDIS